MLQINGSSLYGDTDPDIERKTKRYEKALKRRRKDWGWRLMVGEITEALKVQIENRRAVFANGSLP